ncbi:DNA repair protein RecO [Paenibacillus senegalensis]|uniref:DNA repair protein RecO n=1 Tax=Paenibacillus senegalensis TaxID=1465766 RepID=UPI000289CCC8|nr:DNA repair protein RecO [Paenibacillus senegalensis]
MLLRTEGIVIRAIDYGESNKIVSLFTRTSGKISLMVRGAKKVRSRHSAIVQLFTHGDFVIYKGAGMGNLNHAEIIHSYREIREDLHKAAYAAYLMELIERLSTEGEANVTLFEQLLAALDAIKEGKDAAIVTHIMELKLLALAGYYPQLRACVQCSRESSLQAFSAGQGGVLCSSCQSSDPYAQPLSGSLLNILQLLQGTDLRRLGNTSVKPQTKHQLKTVLRAFLDTHLDARWKSRNFLDQLDKYEI